VTPFLKVQKLMDITEKGSIFTKKYNIKQLMYYEETDDIGEAIHREKQLKKWKRDWKKALIEESNPNWNDLAKSWFDEL